MNIDGIQLKKMLNRAFCLVYFTHKWSKYHRTIQCLVWQSSLKKIRIIQIHFREGLKHVAQRFGYANTTISFLDLSESAFAMQPGLVQAECRMLVMFLCMLSMLPIQNWKFQQMDSRSCSINIQSDLVLIWKHVISPITKIFLTNKTTSKN